MSEPPLRLTRKKVVSGCKDTENFALKYMKAGQKIRGLTNKRHKLKLVKI